MVLDKIMRIVISCGNTPVILGYANKLAKELAPHVVGVVIENRTSVHNRISYLNCRLKKYGFWKTCDQVLLLIYRMFFVTDKRSNPKPSMNFVETLTQLHVENINNPRVREFILNQKADFLINLGTGYMKKEIFDAARITSINIHAGINPRYRGVDPNPWAISEGNFDLIGTTIHKIDAGLDTGEILFQKRISIHGTDTLESITWRSFETGVEGMIELMREFEKSNRFPPVDLEPLTEKHYGWYGLSDYLKARKRLRHYQTELLTRELGQQNNLAADLQRE
jgi:hypothetical protein